MFLIALQTSGNFSIEGLRSMDLWAQGLFVVLVGLIGVFLVLTLFFVTIIIMQKIAGAIKKNAPDAEGESAD